MAIAATVLDVDNSGKSLYLVLSLTFTGSYSTGGDTLDLTSTGAGVLGKGTLGRVFQAGKAPLYGFAGGLNGNSYGFIPGSGSPPNLNNQKIKIFVAGSATELAAGAYPAGVTGDTVLCELAFDLNL